MTARNTDLEDKAAALANAVPFDLHLTSNAKEVETLAKHFFDRYIYEKGRARYYRIANTIIAVLLNLLSAYLHDEERYVRYSRRSGRYSFTLYNRQKISLDGTSRVVRSLNRLIENHVGIPGIDSFENGKQSRMRATPELIKLMEDQFGVTEDMIERIEDEVVIKRDRKDDSGFAAPIDYKDTAKTRSMRNNLKTINRALSDQDINIFIPDDELFHLNRKMGRDPDRVPIDFGRRRLRRIFNNNSFKQGGRFYHGWWQEVPKEYRSFIQINGRQTEEIDYSGMHFAIFYARKGLEAPDDPYQLHGVDSDWRNLVKKALNAVINATSDEKATKAIGDKRRFGKLPPRYPDAESLLEALKDLHRPISDYFCSGAGLHAQYIDSCVAERVMLAMIARDIIVLPVHDSFLVDERNVDVLRAEMTEAFEDIVRGKCEIDAKTPPWRTYSELFPESPEGLIRSRNAIDSGRYKGYYERELKWQRKLKARAQARDRKPNTHSHNH